MTTRVPQAMAVIQMLSAPVEQSAVYTNVSASKAIMAQGFRDTVMVSVLIFNFTDICSVGYFTILVVFYIIINNYSAKSRGISPGAILRKIEQDNCFIIQQIDKKLTILSGQEKKNSFIYSLACCGVQNYVYRRISVT